MDNYIKQYSLRGSHAREFLNLFQSSLGLSRNDEIHTDMIEVWNSEHGEDSELRLFDSSNNLIRSLMILHPVF